MANIFRILLLAALTAASGWAQIWDRAGNGKLNGDYLFRNTAWAIDDFGDMSAAYSVYGVIRFDGRGNYNITSGTYFNLSPAQLSPYTLPGTYSIGANGYGFMQHPNPLLGNARLLLTVTDGVVLGNSVDANLNDIFMAVPVGSATAATLNGNYSMAYMNFNTSNGRVEQHYDALAKFTANGAGNIGAVQVRAYLAESGTTPINLTENGVTYQVQNGLGRIDFPTATNLAIRGQHMLGISPDGNLIFGGSLTGIDFWIGVRRTDGAAPIFGGLYFQAGINLDASDLANGGAFDTYLGSVDARDSVLGHQRILTPRRSSVVNYTYSADTPILPGVEFEDTASSTLWTFSADGAIRVGFGIGPYLGIAVGVRTLPPEGGPEPYLSSVGVLNGASFAPFTAGIARGQLITLFGSGLADGLVQAQSTTLPTSLGGVEVRINNRPAPLIYVSPTQVAAIVPYGTTESIAQIQIIRNSVTSNAVTAWVYASAPGVFAQNARGFGYGAVLDLNYQLVTPENPVDPGEFFAIYLTGLGDVFPTLQDGAPGGTVQLNETLTDPIVRIAGLNAEVAYSGLAPGYAGLYQINAKVPDGVSGDVSLEVEIAGGATAQVLIPVSGGASAARRVAPARR